MEQQGEKRSRLRIPTLAVISVLWAVASLSCDLFQVASTDYDPSDLDMVRIPSGSFSMGSNDENAGADEAPEHIATLDSFRISRHEVSQSKFHEIMGYNPSWFVEAGVSDDYPVESVSWYDAVEFCNMLSEKEFLDPVYIITMRIPASGPITSATVVAEYEFPPVEGGPPKPKNGYRLPTEAQWEYAAIRKTGNAYVWGDANLATTADANAWLNVNSGNKVHPAGRKIANSWGLYDMAGNVWELCGDWYGPYAEAAATNPLSPDSGSFRVLRGGNWSDPLSSLRAATRSHMDPVAASKNIGFRVVAP